VPFTSNTNTYVPRTHREEQEKKAKEHETKKGSARSIDRSDGELRLLITVASSRCGGIDVVVRRWAGATVVLQLQPGSFNGRGRGLEVSHLALEHGAVGGESGRRDVEIEGDAEEEVDLQVVHLHQADAAHTREVGVVVTSALHKAPANSDYGLVHHKFNKLQCTN
jgi:hypothetical protein